MTRTKTLQENKREQGEDRKKSLNLTSFRYHFVKKSDSNDFDPIIRKQRSEVVTVTKTKQTKKLL